MREEDLSFQLLQDANTVHKYILSVLFDRYFFHFPIHIYLFYTILIFRRYFYRYVASRGQREKEEDIYEVFPPTITVRHQCSARIVRQR